MTVARIVIALIVLTTGLTQMAFAEQRPMDRQGVVAAQKADKTAGTILPAPQTVHSVILSPGDPGMLKPHGPIRMPTRLPPRH